MEQKNLAKILENLLNIKKQIDETINLINIEPSKTTEILNKIKLETTEYFEEDNKIIEGIFNGEIMIGPDGKQYSIPANYISKSKIVEGDKMKLTIKKDGTSIFKQIEQIDRIKIVGKLIKDEINKGFAVLSEGKAYRAQKASVTYYKGEIGDEVIAIIPSHKNCIWAAIENITKSNTNTQEENENYIIPKENEQEPQKLNLSSLNQVTPISLDDIK